MQLLEGEEAVVRALLARIKDDERHRDMTVLRSDDDLGRLFRDWSTGFRDVDADPVTVGGCSDVLSRPGPLADGLRAPTTGHALVALLRRLR